MAGGVILHENIKTGIPKLIGPEVHKAHSVELERPWWQYVCSLKKRRRKSWYVAVYYAESRGAIAYTVLKKRT